jgi:hypothetical protein
VTAVLRDGCRSDATAPADPPTGRVPGQLLLHPGALVAIGVIAVNDHVLKPWLGNTVTGKLSDVAGLFVFPLVVLATLEWVRWAIRRVPVATRRQEVGEARRHDRRASSNQEAVVAVGVTAGGFAAVKLLPVVGTAYVTAIGGVRWVGESAVSLMAGEGVASLASIHLTRDPSDLVALPVLLVSYLVARQSVEPAPG